MTVICQIPREDSGPGLCPSSTSLGPEDSEAGREGDEALGPFVRAEQTGSVQNPNPEDGHAASFSKSSLQKGIHTWRF